MVNVSWDEIVHFLEQQISEARQSFPDIRNHIRDRSIGIISKEEWEKIRMTHIAVLGVGGIGMPLLELLVRAGAEMLTIVDMDVIDPTNLNRVPWAFPFTYGQKKIEVANLFARLINPNVKIRKFETITSQNVAEVLEGVDVVALTLDGLYSSLVTSKYCHEHGIPFIEGWALSGIINARIFMPEGPAYEEVYDLKIRKDYDELTEAELRQLEDDFTIAISKISRDTTRHYTSQGLRMMLDGKPRRSFSSFVWIISAIIASELIFKMILQRELPQKIAPHVLLYDYMRYVDLVKKERKKELRTEITEILADGLSLKDKTNAILDLLL